MLRVRRPSRPGGGRVRQRPRPGAAPARHGRGRATGAASRAALWRYAGLERDADGLRRLAEDPYPLARLIAGSALTRQESRGAHQRTDFPSIDDALEQVHITLGADGEPQLSSWN